MSYFKHILTAIILLGVSNTLRGASTTHAPDTYPDYPWLRTNVSQTPMDKLFPATTGFQVKSNNDITAHTPALPVQDYGDVNGISENPGLLWGTDKLVTDEGSLTWGWLSTDDADNGDMYVAVLKHAAGAYDTISFFVTSDGNTWTEWPYPVYYPDGDTVFQVEIVVDTGANPWIYTFTHSQDAGTPNSGSIILRRVKADGSTPGTIWIWLVEPGDSVKNISVDMNENGTLYLSYMKLQSSGSWSVYAISSTDQGETWSSPILISSGNRNTPEIAIGNDNYFYVSYIVDDTILRIGRNTNGLSGSWNFTDVETDGDGEFTPSVAASRQQVGSSQTAWVLYRNYHSNTGNYDTHYAYTTDGGATWTATVWPPANFAYGQQRWPWAHTSLDYPYDIVMATSVAYPSGASDSIITTWAYASDPTTWYDRVIVNDHAPTTEFGPRIELNTNPGGTVLLVYREFATGLVWSDYWYNTDVAEKGSSDNPRVKVNLNVSALKNNLKVAFALPYTSNVKLELFSSEGRKVRNLLNSNLNKGNYTYTFKNNLKPGKYFLKLTTDKTQQTGSIILVK